MRGAETRPQGRRWRLGGSLVLVAAAAVSGYAWAEHQAAAPPTVAVQMLKVGAKRYVFEPNHLVLKKGQTVDIELTTADVVMGFSVPDFHARGDILPGQTLHVRFTPDKVGEFAFLCDIFCGSGHEDMDGTISVVE